MGHGALGSDRHKFMPKANRSSYVNTDKESSAFLNFSFLTCKSGIVNISPPHRLFTQGYRNNALRTMPIVVELQVVSDSL